jgi:hypothetical protein
MTSSASSIDFHLSSSTSGVTFIEMGQRNDLFHLIKNGFVATSTRIGVVSQAPG